MNFDEEVVVLVRERKEHGWQTKAISLRPIWIRTLVKFFLAMIPLTGKRRASAFENAHAMYSVSRPPPLLLSSTGRANRLAISVLLFLASLNNLSTIPTFCHSNLGSWTALRPHKWEKRGGDYSSGFFERIDPETYELSGTWTHPQRWIEMTPYRRLITVSSRTCPDRKMSWPRTIEEHTTWRIWI